jgi:hypothetical protein
VNGSCASSAAEARRSDKTSWRRFKQPWNELSAFEAVLVCSQTDTSIPSEPSNIFQF